MLKFNVEDRVGTMVIERASAGNVFTGEIVRQLGEMMRRAEEAEIVTLAGVGADFTIGRDRHEPKSGSPFDAFRNISSLNKTIAEFPGVLITGVRDRAFGLGVGLILRSDIAIAAADARSALDEVKLGIAPMFVMEQILEYLPAKRALDFHSHRPRIRRRRGAADRPRFARGWAERPRRHGGELVARCVRTTVASCSPASAICVPLAKCRPRPARLTRLWNTRNLPWRY